MSFFGLSPLHDSMRYHPAHALIPIQSGARCRICAFLYDKDNKYSGLGGGFCAAHKSVKTRFCAFARACCKLQDNFKQMCKQRPPPPMVRAWRPLIGMTASELWWWEMLNVFQQQCEYSLVALSPFLDMMLQQGWCSSEFR
jgi:hypothetical protein